MALEKTSRMGTTSQKKRKFTALSPVSVAVRPVVKNILPQKCMFFQQLFDIWPELVASGEAKGTVPEKLMLARGKQRDGVLHLWAQTGAQAMEVTFNKHVLLQTINAVFGYQLVSDLRVTAFPAANRNEGNVLKSRKRDSFSCQSLDKELDGISNQSLRSALLDFGGALYSDHTMKKGQHHA